jgi:DNA-directed RNA polymerase subunit M/transcription elongation factor TFIIS
MNKENRTFSQTITIICATCGEHLKINNRYESEILKLYDDELLLDCPKCKYVYDIPYKKV